ncbi:MAG: glucose-1-phosphate adenylyltransferase subunit GlgD [Clostridia bacterium]|nr:glucose-1-phosphate adenylyltransferase subunit GlgD [Clostridia bacterium]
MMPKNVLGIVYSNSYDSCLKDLTQRRTMGSMLYGGRYRLIDFVLSNFVNSGMTNVGLITNSHFRSLMDHVGNGRPWDLSRKVDGLYLLPPFNPTNAEHDSTNKLAVLGRIKDFVKSCNEKYILLSDTNFICNIDLSEVFDFHSEKDADITIVYKKGTLPSLENMMSLTVDGNNKVTGVAVNPQNTENVNFSTNIILMRKALFESLIADAISAGYTNFEKDIIQKSVDNLNIYGYEFTGWGCEIDSVEKYFEANMALLDKDIRKDLFNKDRPVYTKVRNDMPVRYGIQSKVENSLIADGCIIEGTVKNSVIFRGVNIARGAVVENSIIMQDSFVSENVKLNCVIMDKDSVITPNKNLSGDKSYPFIVGKNIVI